MVLTEDRSARDAAGFAADRAMHHCQPLRRVKP
jgi:hypothetical protein